ncbi:ABC-type bacteriocin/lantibiotic exporter [Hoeflea phototrophica DFL-43]|uniref:ABC-type bacteriocin/lantibiotic exporter n=1 Tax=Hoeflea phototrophica (strain DSM 17068 / NCIMB 14078 / DFL-43) TaxID=411684 RepID=A9CZU6_HOEPD|nr:ABC transporter ATP-binding protein [Hoeflea phototrophica]EDQ34849.2 ABC-type bacteriocin/lantibiotic exporter [Hoeflea phototrophica DFL-43]
MGFLVKRLLSNSLSPEGLSFIKDQLWPRRFKVAGLLTLSLFAAIIEMTGLGLVFPLLILIVEPHQIERFQFLVWLTGTLGIDAGTSTSIFLIALIGGIMVAKNAYMLIFNRLQYSLLAQWKTELSYRLMRVYIFSDFELHLSKSSSEIIRNISLTAAVFDQYITAIISLTTNGIMLTALGLLLFAFLPGESIYGLIAIFVIAVMIYYFMRRRFEDIGREMNSIFQRRQSILRQSIGMIKETKLLARESFFLESFKTVEGRNFNRQAHYNFLSSFPPLAIEGAVILAILSLVGYILILSGSQPVGFAILGVMAATLFRVAPLVNRILTGLQMMNLSKNSVEIVAKELSDQEGKVYQPTVEPKALSFKHQLRLEGVSYSYPTGNAPAVRNVSVEIPRNGIIGITGTSGSGKSTLVTLMMGLLRPQCGSIKVDGDMLNSQEALRAWHRHIGYVPQSVFLIEDSIARNVAFAAGAEELDEGRIRSTLEVVQLWDFVQSLPNGMHEFVGEDGNRLSGGQRQRLGIARALYADPEVLVLDEATSALDAAIEKAFTDSLMRLRGSRTIIIIAHRLSTLRECDQVIMMEKGEVIDMASFETLESRCPSFKQLVDLSRLDKLPS